MNNKQTIQTMHYWTIYQNFSSAFKSAKTDEEQNAAVRTYMEELTQHGYVLARHIQGPIKKGSSGWGLRKKDMRVQSDPYSAYNWR